MCIGLYFQVCELRDLNRYSTTDFYPKCIYNALDAAALPNSMGEFNCVQWVSFFGLTWDLIHSLNLQVYSPHRVWAVFSPSFLECFVFDRRTLSLYGVFFSENVLSEHTAEDSKLCAVRGAARLHWLHFGLGSISFADWLDSSNLFLSPPLINFTLQLFPVCLFVLVTVSLSVIISICLFLILSDSIGNHCTRPHSGRQFTEVIPTARLSLGRWVGQIAAASRENLVGFMGTNRSRRKGTSQNSLGASIWSAVGCLS